MKPCPLDLTTSKFATDFQRRMEGHLIEFKAQRQHLPGDPEQPWLYRDLADNLFPPIRPSFLQYLSESGMPLHGYANHVRSSQAYGVNVFFYLLRQHPQKLVDYLNELLGLQMKAITGYHFEYTPEQNVLGEWSSDAGRGSAYVTATDLLILGLGADQTRYAILVEVKFTEPGFSECGGYHSSANAGPTRDACATGGLLLDDHRHCYLHGSHGASRLRRTYFDLVPPAATFIASAFAAACPFIETHQCLRNHALMNHFIAHGFEARFLLLHHEANHDVVAQWQGYTGLLLDHVKPLLRAVSGRSIVEAVGDQIFRDYYRDRYVLAGRQLDVTREV